MANGITRWIAHRRFGMGVRVQYYTRIANFLTDGIPLHRTLDEFHARYVEREDSSRAWMLEEWIRIIDQGLPITQAMKGWATENELMMIGAGEESSALQNGFRSAAHFTSTQKKIRSIVISAVAYPAFLMLLLFFITGIAAFKLMPEFAAVIPVSGWPAVGASYYAFSEVVREHWMLMIIGIFLFFGAVFFSMPRIKRSKLRMVLDKMPIYSTYRELVGASALMAIGAQVNNGVPVRTAIRNIIGNASPYLASHMRVAERRIGSGVNAGQALDTKLFNDDLTDDLIAYSRLSNFAQAIESIGRRLSEDILERIAMRAGAINAMMMMLVAIMIIWMLAGVGMTAFEFSNSAQTGAGI